MIPGPQHVCQLCGKVVGIVEACAIGKTFVIFYYCPPCYEIAASGVDEREVKGKRNEQS